MSDPTPNVYALDPLVAAIPAPAPPPATVAALHTAVLSTLEPHAALLDALRANNAPVTRPAGSTAKPPPPGVRAHVQAFLAQVEALLPAAAMDRHARQGLDALRKLLAETLRRMDDPAAFREVYYKLLPRAVLAARDAVDDVRDLDETLGRLRELECARAEGAPITPEASPRGSVHVHVTPPESPREKCSEAVRVESGMRQSRGEGGDRHVRASQDSPRSEARIGLKASKWAE